MLKYGLPLNLEELLEQNGLLFNLLIVVTLIHTFSQSH